MKETQFILWLQGFLSGKASIDVNQTTELKRQLDKVRLDNNSWTTNNTNESFPGTGKQMLHD